MSLQYRWNYLSGRYQTDLTRQWQIGSLEGTVDPVIPSLPLNNPAAGGALSLTGDAGAYTITGTAASLEFGREVIGASGSYAITGTVASLEYGREALALAGSYAVTGTAASLEFGREVLGLAGAYTITGTAASLESGREVIGASGSYAITGTDATLTKAGGNKSLALDGGAYVITGSDATLVKAGADKTIPADGGSYAISGANASLVYESSEVTGGGHAWKGPAEPRYRVHPEYEDKPKKKRKREKVGEQVILAGEPEIQTGIIEVTPARDALGELQRKQAEAEQARRDRLRAIALADDEWLMVA